MLICEVKPHEKKFADKLAHLYETDEYLLLSSTLTSGRFLDFIQPFCGTPTQHDTGRIEGFARAAREEGGKALPPERALVVAQTPNISSLSIRLLPSLVCGYPEATAPDHRQLRFVPYHRTPE